MMCLMLFVSCRNGSCDSSVWCVCSSGLFVMIWLVSWLVKLEDG